MVLAAWCRAPSPQPSPTRRRRAGEGRNLWVGSWVAGETRAEGPKRNRVDDVHVEAASELGMERAQAVTT